MTAIKLLYAKNVIMRHHGTAQQELVFALAVRNLAYEKHVEVAWAGEDGQWRSLEAEYLGAMGGNFERWHARAAFQMAAGNSLPGDIQFTLRARVSGHEYRNPHGRQTYTIDADSGVYLPQHFPLMNIDFQPQLHAGQQYHPITVAVGQEIRPATVSIRWTTNHWRTFTDTPAFFRRRHWDHAVGSNARNPNRYGCALWISQLHLGDAYQVEYALVGEAAGREYWDNNFGANYLARHTPLRVLTLNLHCYQEEQQDEKFSRIAQAIRDLRIDVVCLQEVGERWNAGRGDWNTNAAKIICDRLGESYFVHSDWGHVGFGQYREGTAILSRYPLLRQESRYVSATRDIYNIHARKIVMAQIRVPGIGAINVFSAHLSWWGDGFREQFENLRQWAESVQTPDVVATFVCGDLNNAANTKGHAIMIDSFDDQFLKANGWHLSRSDDRRIDYIFMKKGSPLAVRSARRLFTVDDYGPVSDHEGYYGEFEPAS